MTVNQMLKPKTPNNDYPYVRVWDTLLGSWEHYRGYQLDMARQDRAPQTAIFKKTPPPGEDWSDRVQSELWETIDPNAAEDSPHQAVLSIVKQKYQLTYEQVKAWDAPSKVDQGR